MYSVTRQRLHLSRRLTVALAWLCLTCGAGSALATPPPAGTLIQNSLNDQHIKTLTIINTGVNSLGLLKALNTQTVLNDALLGALGSR